MIISTYPKVKFYIENPYTNHLVSRIIFTSVYFIMSFPYGSVGKESVCNVGDPGSIPGLGRSPGEGKGYPLQYSWASLVAQLVKNPPALQETWVPFLA